VCLKSERTCKGVRGELADRNGHAKDMNTHGSLTCGLFNHTTSSSHARTIDLRAFLTSILMFFFLSISVQCLDSYSQLLPLN
jgi:hypothetical protein